MVNIRNELEFEKQYKNLHDEIKAYLINSKYNYFKFTYFDILEEPITHYQNPNNDNEFIIFLSDSNAQKLINIEVFA